MFAEFAISVNFHWNVFELIITINQLATFIDNFQIDINPNRYRI